MISRLFLFIVVALAVPINSAALVRPLKRDSSSLQTTLPQDAANSTARAQEILTRRAGYLYGPSLIGNTSFFPTGSLGDALVQTEISAFEVDAGYETAKIDADLPTVEQAVAANGGLNSFDDYAHVLYQNEWQTSVPGGEDPGMLTNYTQDLLFSMERLTINPYPLQRVNPKDTLPFTIDDSTSKEISCLTLKALQSSGRLFIVDHSYQSAYSKSARFGAACTAYFFIHPTSGDFLPLAIKTNVGSNLTYTPLDSLNDWLLAKLMFNVNDVFHAEMYHLIASHSVAEIVHEAALRSLSGDHPIMVLLDRLMTQAYAIRPVGTQVLFNPGGSFDHVFYISSDGAKQYATENYPTAGAYKSNYYHTLFTSKGLINSSLGPSLKSFPFNNDVSALLTTIRKFICTFVDTYYKSTSDITNDNELHAWFNETIPAEVIDFPTAEELKSGGKEVLIDILTHQTYLTGILHHALNTGGLSTQWPLPFHPTSLYSPIPTSKNISDAALLAFLPPVDQSLFQLDLFASFARPQYEAQNRTLAFAFSDPTFLGRFKEEVIDAAGKYKGEMQRFSQGVRGRGFGRDGLWEGTPFVWKGLDPGSIPFFLAV